MTLLGKKCCKEMRSEAFHVNKNWLMTEMDYAERLVKQIDGEIQSNHLDKNTTLSIEGCTLQYQMKRNKNQTSSSNKSTYLDFHSHFVPYSYQGVATMLII